MLEVDLKSCVLHLHALPAPPLPVNGKGGKVVAEEGDAHIQQVPQPNCHDRGIWPNQYAAVCMLA